MRTSSSGKRNDTFRSRRGAGGSPAGFSLTELLVVIAIVAVITVMLAPAVQQDLAQEEQVVCANNWRQVYMLAYAFFDDAGHWPIGLDYVTKPSPHWWFQDLFPNVGEGTWTWGPLGPGAEHEYDPRILDCPSNAGTWPGGFAYWTPVNAAPNMVQSPGNPGNNLADLPENPEVWPWIVDGSIGFWSKSQIGGGSSGRIDVPHNNGSNIAFYDGHVAWSPLEDLPAVLFDNWIDLD